MGRGPLIIAFDGTPAAERAIRDAAALLGRRPTVVAVVWKAGLAFELVELPTATIGLPPAPIDVRTAVEIDERNYESARNLARQGARRRGGAALPQELARLLPRGPWVEPPTTDEFAERIARRTGPDDERAMRAAETVTRRMVLDEQMLPTGESEPVRSRPLLSATGRSTTPWRRRARPTGHGSRSP